MTEPIEETQSDETAAAGSDEEAGAEAAAETESATGDAE